MSKHFPIFNASHKVYFFFLIFVFKYFGHLTIILGKFVAFTGIVIKD